MKIAVASGKGGTGKTTVSINLYLFIARFLNRSVSLVDCDVEEPNDVLFFQEAEKIWEKQEYMPISEIDAEKCTFCRKCVDWCEFNAITIVKSLGFVEADAGLCHSCGACKAACEFDAISELFQPLGTISAYNTKVGMGIMEGCLQIGSSMQTALIKKIKQKTPENADITIFDAPPGTSCPVVETIANVDFVILVTEPTPFGLYDLKIMVELLMSMNKTFGVVVNKAGLGTSEVYKYLLDNNIGLLAEIPFSRNYASEYAAGKILENIPVEMVDIYRLLTEKLKIK